MWATDYNDDYRMAVRLTGIAQKQEKRGIKRTPIWFRTDMCTHACETHRHDRHTCAYVTVCIRVCVSVCVCAYAYTMAQL